MVLEIFLKLLLICHCPKLIVWSRLAIEVGDYRLLARHIVNLDGLGLPLGGSENAPWQGPTPLLV